MSVQLTVDFIICGDLEGLLGHCTVRRSILVTRCVGQYRSQVVLVQQQLCVLL